MRRPKKGGQEKSDDSKQAGGRAWKRLQQDSLARGLPIERTPPEPSPEKKRRVKKSARKSAHKRPS